MLAFWDNVVVLTRYREGFVHKVYGSEKGIGAPDKPVNRRDKNVRKWYLSIVRHGPVFLDALHLVSVVAKARRSGATSSSWIVTFTMNWRTCHFRMR